MQSKMTMSKVGFVHAPCSCTGFSASKRDRVFLISNIPGQDDKSNRTSSSISLDSEPDRSVSGKGQGFPVNFGKVIPNVYRSAFPGPCHLESLDTLELKTIM